MQVLALRPGDSAWAVSSQYQLRYVSKEAAGYKLELTFEDRSVFTVVTGKAVSVDTVWARVPEQFTIQADSELRIGKDCITIRELSYGKISVNYFGESQFVVIPMIDVESPQAGSLTLRR